MKMVERLFHTAPVDMDDLNAHLKLLGADICDIDTKIQERLEEGPPAIMMVVDKVQRMFVFLFFFSPGCPPFL